MVNGWKWSYLALSSSSLAMCHGIFHRLDLLPLPFLLQTFIFRSCLSRDVRCTIPMSTREKGKHTKAQVKNQNMVTLPPGRPSKKNPSSPVDGIMRL